VHAGDAGEAEAAPRFGEDALAFLDAKRLEGLVLEPLHGLAFVVIADPAFEADEGAAAAIHETGTQGPAIDRCVGEGEVAHPPATGGMNTTASPPCSG
jgi:hypothetical protein